MPAVFRREPNGRLTEIWRDSDRGFLPWKIDVTELDGDPLPEIAIGVLKKTRHDRHLARRLFIYDWTGSCLAPKWLGSKLGAPLINFTFEAAPSGRHQHLVTRERGLHGIVKRRYRWNGFGFVEDAEEIK